MKIEQRFAQALLAEIRDGFETRISKENDGRTRLQATNTATGEVKNNFFDTADFSMHEALMREFLRIAKYKPASDVNKSASSKTESEIIFDAEIMDKTSRWMLSIDEDNQSMKLRHISNE